MPANTDRKNNNNRDRSHGDSKVPGSYPTSTLSTPTGSNQSSHALPTPDTPTNRDMHTEQRPVKKDDERVPARTDATEATPPLSPVVLEMASHISAMRSMVTLLKQSLSTIDSHTASLEKSIPAVKVAEQVTTVKAEIEAQITAQKEEVKSLQNHMKVEIERALKERLLDKARSQMRESAAGTLANLVRQKAAQRIKDLFADYEGRIHDTEITSAKIQLKNSEARRRNGLASSSSNQTLEGLIPITSSTISVPHAFPKDMGSLFSLTKDHVVSLLEAYEIPAPPFTPAGQGNIYAKTTLVDALNALMHHIGVEYQLHAVPSQGKGALRGAQATEPFITRKFR